MRRFFILALLLLVTVCVVVVVNFRRNLDKLNVDWQIKKQLPIKVVEVEHPRRAEIVQTVTAPGTIELVDEADIASQIMGQVEAVPVEKGDRVKTGDLLVKLNDEDAKARLESTEARIERLKAAIELSAADLNKARLDFAGYRQLEERGFSTPNEVRDGQTVLTKMEAALEMSQHELTESFAMRRNSEQEVERTEIRAPMDGTVIDLDVEVGEVVIAGTTNLPGTVLMTIGDMSKMRVRADVDETDVALVRPEQPTRIYLQADQAVPIAGRVDLIAPKGSHVNEVVSFETLINVEGRHQSLRPEMTATVEIEVQRVDRRAERTCAGSGAPPVPGPARHAAVSGLDRRSAGNTGREGQRRGRAVCQDCLRGGGWQCACAAGEDRDQRPRTHRDPGRTDGQGPRDCGAVPHAGRDGGRPARDDRSAGQESGGQESGGQERKATASGVQAGQGEAIC